MFIIRIKASSIIYHCNITNTCCVGFYLLSLNAYYSISFCFATYMYAHLLEHKTSKFTYFKNSTYVYIYQRFCEAKI